MKTNLTILLITGGCGFVGSWLARCLVNEGHDVVLFDLNVNDKLVKDISRQIKIRKASITGPREVTEQPARADAILIFQQLKNS